jgi:hypothetical protein
MWWRYADERWRLVALDVEGIGDRSPLFVLSDYQPLP